jgi:hypothetical protein
MDTQQTHELAITELLPIAKQSEAYAATVDGIEIHDDDQLAQVGDLKKDLNHYRRKLEDKRLSLVGPLKKVSGDIDAMFKAPRDKIDAVIAACTKKMKAYVTRLALVEAEARRKEEKEAREREERLRKAAETVRQDTHDVHDVVAEVLEKQADAAEIAADSAPKQRSAPVRGNRASVSVTRTWKAEVVDVKLACAAVAAGKLPASVVTFNMAELHGLARAVETAQTQDGVRFFEDIGTAVR